VIPVQARAEPAYFEEKIRKKGLAFLAKAGIALDQSAPENFEFNPYWRDCLDDLYRTYDGVCAYLCVHFERIIGGASVDHFVTKSSLPMSGTTIA
jgi:hypothetical protein